MWSQYLETSARCQLSVFSTDDHWENWKFQTNGYMLAHVNLFQVSYIRHIQHIWLRKNSGYLTEKEKEWLY